MLVAAGSTHWRQSREIGWVVRVLALSAALLLLQPLPAQSSDGAKNPVPVLLTFDVEAESDIAALRTLDVNVPATYFVTGAFAEKHERLVRELARKGTVGSHSYDHPHLTKIKREEAFKDLTLAQLVLEKVLGQPPRWFRAPFLEYDEAIATKLKDLGIRYDSSDQERWQQNETLTSLPISNNADGVLAADYQLFNVQKLSADEALVWLKKAYLERVPTGRPFVFLMHPRLIAPYAAALHGFMDFVREQGGVFLSADDYVKRSQSHSPAQKGFWVDLSLGPHTPEKIVQDAQAMKATDVFLMAKDPSGNLYFAREADGAEKHDDLFGEIHRQLKKAGIRVHAWLPVNMDANLAQLRPDLAMVSQSGEKSIKWLSPSHPEVRQNFLSLVNLLLKQYPLDGIHLDYIRYPGLEMDFGPRAMAGIREKIGNPSAKTSDLLNSYYGQWMEWRFDEIASLVDDVRATVKAAGDEILLSAALIGEAAVSYRAAEQFGQDYSRLANSLDVVMPMAYFKESRRPLEWISDVVSGARYKVGNRPIYVGLEAYQKANQWSLDRVTFSRSIKNAAPGSNGIIFYPYLYMFGRGDEADNLPADSREVIFSQDIAPASETGSIGLALRAPEKLWHSFSPQASDVTTFLSGSLAALFGASIFAFVRRRATGRNQPHNFAATIEEPHQSMSDMLERLVDLRDWKSLSDRLQAEQIPTEVCICISQLLRKLGARGIEKNRIVLILESCERLGGSLQQVLSDVSIAPEWKKLGMQYLQEAYTLGLIDMSSGWAQLTATGAAELERARDDGFDRAFWEFIERCLHETLLATCPKCGTANLAHWFWSDVECRGCGESAPLTRWNNIRRSGTNPV